MKVIKRDGSIQEFTFDKVRAVVQKAYGGCDREVPEKFVSQLEEIFNKLIHCYSTLSQRNIIKILF